MKYLFHGKVWVVLFLGLLFGSFVLFDKKVSAEIVGHIVISEVQIKGDIADDEFIELYNPTNVSVDISDWKITRKTSGGSENNLVNSFPDSTLIAGHSYLLVAHPAFDGTDMMIPDVLYTAVSQPLATNNTVLLYDGSDTVVDKVGMGTATDVEALSVPVPADGESVERKANADSDLTSMGSGGDDELMGNGEDTDNNNNDFVSRSIPGPQNSSSPTETSATPTPTEVPTPIPSEIPSLTPSEEPEPTPTNEPDPTPTEEPTPTPTSEITPSPTPTQEPEPSPTPPTGKAVRNFEIIGVTCSLQKRTFIIGGFGFSTPWMVCVKN